MVAQLRVRRTGPPASPGRCRSTAKVRVDSTLTDVLIFGGGYDTGQDRVDYAEDDEGRGIYMVNALTGDLIWRAGPDAGANLQLTNMKHSIPGDVRVIDLTGDGLADRMYAADLGGRVWRFDIFNGRNRTMPRHRHPRAIGWSRAACSRRSVTSRTRTEDVTQHDPVLLRAGPGDGDAVGGTTFINVAIGSGHRELPATDKTVQNWFFSVRDYNVLTPLRLELVQELVQPVLLRRATRSSTRTDLEDLTALGRRHAPPPACPIGTERLDASRSRRRREGAGRSPDLPGRRVSSRPIRRSSRGSTEDGCGIKFGLNKLYIVDAAGRAAGHESTTPTTGEATDDRSSELAQGSISPEVVFVFPTPPNTEPERSRTRRAAGVPGGPRNVRFRPDQPAGAYVLAPARSQLMRA